MSFEDKLKQEMDDYCRFKCPVKNHHLGEQVEIDWECGVCGDTFGVSAYVDLGRACDNCQVVEFVRYIRDMEE